MSETDKNIMTDIPFEINFLLFTRKKEILFQKMTKNNSKQTLYLVCTNHIRNMCICIVAQIKDF